MKFYLDIFMRARLAVIWMVVTWQRVWVFFLIFSDSIIGKIMTHPRYWMAKMAQILTCRYQNKMVESVIFGCTKLLGLPANNIVHQHKLYMIDIDRYIHKATHSYPGRPVCCLSPVKYDKRGHTNVIKIAKTTQKPHEITSSWKI